MGLRSPAVAIPLLIGTGVALTGWYSTVIGLLCLVVAAVWLLWLLAKRPAVRRRFPVIERLAAYFGLSLDSPDERRQRTGYKGRPGSYGDVSQATFHDTLDTGIDNQGEVDASEAKFGVSSDDDDDDKSDERRSR